MREVSSLVGDRLLGTLRDSFSLCGPVKSKVWEGRLRESEEGSWGWGKSSAGDL